MSAARPRITVIGSINMDLVVRCETLPRPGETILAQSAEEVCGGKGANQAVAAARAGGSVTMIGRVGTDAFAGRLVDNLKSEGIDCNAVQQTNACASGLAIVAVDEGGQNSIMVVSGANARVSGDDVRSMRSVIESSDLVLLQLEVPVDTVLIVIEIARVAGVRVILDPAPALREWPKELLQVDLLCPNESEAEALVGQPIESIDQTESAAKRLHEMGARHVAITLGHRGSMLCDGRNTEILAPFSTHVVDTTAAGDAFAGALAVRWAENATLDEAIRFANAAGALAASRRGAQVGMPTRNEIEILLTSSP